MRLPEEKYVLVPTAKHTTNKATDELQNETIQIPNIRNSLAVAVTDAHHQKVGLNSIDIPCVELPSLQMFEGSHIDSS